MAKEVPMDSELARNVLTVVTAGNFFSMRIGFTSASRRSTRSFIHLALRHDLDPNLDGQSLKNRTASTQPPVHGGEFCLPGVRQAGGGLFRREDALVYRAGFLNKTGPVEVTLRDKLNNFAHFALQGWKFGGDFPPMNASASNSLGLPRWKTFEPQLNAFTSAVAILKNGLL
jgi:hypothetical protein